MTVVFGDLPYIIKVITNEFVFIKAKLMRSGVDTNMCLVAMFSDTG